jgi:hypothetical protein
VGPTPNAQWSVGQCERIAPQRQRRCVAKPRPSELFGPTLGSSGCTVNPNRGCVCPFSRAIHNPYRVDARPLVPGVGVPTPGSATGPRWGPRHPCSATGPVGAIFSHLLTARVLTAGAGRIGLIRQVGPIGPTNRPPQSGPIGVAYVRSHCSEKDTVPNSRPPSEKDTVPNSRLLRTFEG